MRFQHPFWRRGRCACLCEARKRPCRKEQAGCHCPHIVVAWWETVCSFFLASFSSRFVTKTWMAYSLNERGRVSSHGCLGCCGSFGTSTVRLVPSFQLGSTGSQSLSGFPFTCHPGASVLLLLCVCVCYRVCACVFDC